MIIRTYQPGQIQNLYDQNRHKILAGVLYFNQLEPQIKEVPVIEEKVEEVIPEQELEPVSVVNPVQQESFSEKFFDFALKVDSVVMGLLSKILHSILLLSPVIATVTSILEDKKEQVNGVLEKAVKVKRIRVAKPKVSVPKVQLPEVTIELPKFSVPTLAIPAISLPAINFARLRLPVAVICLLFSFLSIGALVFPLVSAQLFSAMPDFAKASPTPTPFRYTSYYQPEHNPLYPIQEFRLSVPKINLESNIVDNVDPNLEDEYKDKLQFGVAHAKGSYLPPETGGPVYLFAHSTDTIFNIARFNAKFYSVRELEPGDQIQLYFNGKEYKYVVREKFIINPQEVDVIKNATDTDLILQTCWPPGTDWQRLIVYADRV